MNTAAENATSSFFDNSLEFVVNELFLQVGDDGKFQIGCDINVKPGPNDWIGLFFNQIPPITTTLKVTGPM